jgi:C-terminal processing protease CtpA/Prc
MKSYRWTWVLVLALALAVPSLAGEDYKCGEDTQACLNKMAAKLKERGWIGIEIDKDEQSGAMTVVKVEEDSPAMEGGFREGDVLKALNGIDFSEDNEAKLQKAWAAMKVGNEVTYTVDRQGCCHIKGGRTEVAVVLAPIPEEIMAKWIGNHMLRGHAAIEVAQN